MTWLAQAIASARAPLAYWEVFPAFPTPYYEEVELDFKDYILVTMFYPTKTQLKWYFLLCNSFACTLHDDEASNGKRLAHNTSKLHLPYFLKVIVSVTFVTSLTWYSGGPILGGPGAAAPSAPA